METTYMDTCLNSKSLSKAINYWAYVISCKRPRTYSIDDCKQILWETVVRASIKNPNTKSVIEDARKAIFSKFGNMIGPGFSMSERQYEYTIQFDYGIEAPSYDHSYSEVNINVTLDQITEYLKKHSKIYKHESGKAKRFNLTVNAITYLRGGYSQKEVANILNRSARYIREAFNETKAYLVSEGVV